MAEGAEVGGRGTAETTIDGDDEETTETTTRTDKPLTHADRVGGFKAVDIASSFCAYLQLFLHMPLTSWEEWEMLALLITQHSAATTLVVDLAQTCVMVEPQSVELRHRWPSLLLRRWRWRLVLSSQSATLSWQCMFCPTCCWAWP